MSSLVTPEIRELVKRYRDIWALNYATSLLNWDMETYMPRGSFRERGEALAVLRTQIQRLYTHPEFISLVESAKPQNDVERGIIRVLKRWIKFYTRLPKEFLEEESRTRAEAFQVWREAKEKSDFQMFRPLLEKIVELQRRKAEYLGYEDHPYDALLDLYEEGLTVKKCDRMFEVVPEVSSLFSRVKEGYPERHPLEEVAYDEVLLGKLIEHVIRVMGFDFSRGRVDVSPHPFTINMGLYDVRITVRYEGRDFRRALMAAVHEFGHATYEMNVDPELWMTPVQGGVSLGVHESQSRFWENLVGRSMPFIRRFRGEMEMALPFVRDYDDQELYRYLTLVRPELIRVEADEVQYVLHIFLRYRLEKSMIEGSLKVDELPQVWNDMMEELVGIRPPNDSLGVLQDIHWAHATIGYFPTYAIGSMLAAQIYRDLDLREEVEEARFGEIMSRLRERIHRHGKVYAPDELVERATGEPLNPDHFLSYLREKYLGGVA